LQDAFINGYSQLVNRPALHKEDLATVRKWLMLNSEAIDSKEIEFINYTDDLIGIQPNANSWLRNVLGSLFVLRTPGIRHFLHENPTITASSETQKADTQYGRIMREFIKLLQLSQSWLAFAC
jgi:hypothetical protein